jgi:hypothetical protein
MVSIRFMAACTLACTMFACGSGDDVDCSAGKCDDYCGDVRYGDGVCDTQLSCETPDIDCFHTFATDDEAATWYAEFEATAAQQEGRKPRALFTQGDPRFAAVRELLDRGWEAFSANRPVGALRAERPALVLVDDASVNAFVAPDPDFKRAGFAVMVHTGVVGTSFSDDASLGLMMHELQHAIGLHVIPEVKQRFQVFYVAPATGEPIGREQTDDADARTAGSAWIAAGRDIGPQSDPALGALPTGGDLVRVLTTVVQEGLAADPTACDPAVDELQARLGELAPVTDPLSGAVAAPDGFAARAAAALARLRDDCLPNFTKTFVEVVAGIAGVPPEQIDAMLPAEDKALIAGLHVVDAIAALTADRRAKMIAIEDGFASATGEPWSALRYFSIEEDADDVSVPVLRGAALDPAGLGTFLAALIADRAACEAVIAGGDVPPYGVDLVDDHHATCFRIYHIGAFAQHTARLRPPTLPLSTPRPRLLPPRLGDVVVY